jgi:hypothetical protein
MAKARAKVSTARIARLYAKHKNFAKVGRIVDRHITCVRSRLVRAGFVK